MIKSMTAFAREDVTQDGIQIVTEIRSYNSRYLDIALRVTHGYLLLEERIKSHITERVARGRIEVNVQIKENGREDSPAFEVDIPKAKAFHQALSQLSHDLKIKSPATLDHFLPAGHFIKPCEVERDAEICWPVVCSSLETALDHLEAMRKKEGAYLGEDFRQRLVQIEERLARIETESDGLLQLYQERLTQRVKSLTSGIVEIDPGRIAQEAAILADRSDISEEIVRARSHIQQFYTIMEQPEPAGRKLNFLLQEFNREFNTMGSKCSKSNISHMIVEIKSELEKLREQVQNIE